MNEFTSPDRLLQDRLALSIEEVARLTGMSRSTVSRQISSGEIRANRSRRRVLIPVAEVKRLCGMDTAA